MACERTVKHQQLMRVTITAQRPPVVRQGVHALRDYRSVPGGETALAHNRFEETPRPLTALEYRGRKMENYLSAIRGTWGLMSHDSISSMQSRSLLRRRLQKHNVLEPVFSDAEVA